MAGLLLYAGAFIVSFIFLFFRFNFSSFALFKKFCGYAYKLASMAFIGVKIRKLEKIKGYNFADFMEDIVDKRPETVQFITVEDEKEHTLSSIDKLANQIGHWGKTVGMSQGDSACLMMLNRPDFFSFWYGMSKIGCRTALLNTNIFGASLLHCAEAALKDSKSKVLVVDEDLKEQFKLESHLFAEQGFKVFFWDEIRESIAKESSDRVSKSHRDEARMSNTLVYIYTSGTTGLPKAANVSHIKCLMFGLPLLKFCELKFGTRVYDCLPLYHSAGGMLCLGAAIHSGATIVLRKKFSVKNFATDCVKYKCTVFQYIGDLCRYLINSPPSKDEDQMSLDFAFGNGMRPDVWETFQRRFHVKNVVEFYGATEGTVGLYNCVGKVGSLGYIPPFLSSFHPIQIIRMDPNKKEEPYRDENGRCILCAENEVGLVVLKQAVSFTGKYEGYSDKTASEKKLLRDVFNKGDLFFNSGDLMTRDRDGFFFWSDRVGDTFRWRGENVSTAEIENVLSSISGVATVAVYGVPVPHTDGKAGMAAFILSQTPPTTTIEELLREVLSKSLVLPVYARPLFVRVLDSVTMTSTYKTQKNDLSKEAYDIDKVKGQVYFCSWKSSGEQNYSFVPVTQNFIKDLNDRKIVV